MPTRPPDGLPDLRPQGSADAGHVDQPDAAVEPTLGAVLLRLAHRATDVQAAVACAGGTLLATVVLLVAPAWWRAALLGVVAAAFGAWIVLERGGSPAAWRAWAQRLALVTGTASAFAVALSLLTRALGIWIS